ncbi:MFS transporter [Thermomonospora catenispora]|uniref:MFS transporter n=1 Tax=Thermomonospora catenispora TaxID=2493090 RepID=UPI00240DDE86|nr:MFS transporter [Thermomonospora catenispora]
MYPLYAVLFARAGLSDAQISSLFVLWSLTTVLLEVPSGLWADRFSRRRLVVCSPPVAACGFAMWTFAPSYPAFAAGFVLWGAGTAMRSGALEALVHEETVRLGAAGRYPRLAGRAEAVRVTAEVAATGAAARSPAGFAPIAAAYAAFRWAIATTQARLQEQVPDRTRATVTSLAGLGAELVGIAAFAGYAATSPWAGPWLIFCLAAPVYLGAAFAMRR